MSKKTGKTNRKTKQDVFLAREHHIAATEFINHATFYYQLIDYLSAKSTESKLLILLLRSKNTLPSAEVEKATNMTAGAISQAAARLDNYLDHFSKNLAILKAKQIKLTVPRRPRGTAHFGYYLALLNIRTNEYLDSNQTRTLLLKNRFDYLSDTEEVLEMLNLNSPEATWFRKTGPIISDFEDMRVYQRKNVNDLIQKVQGNSFYLLVGGQATGKTVIVRTLMYRMHNLNKSQIYYFDIATKRNFSEIELVREIRSVKGIFIIENIHLELHKAQWLYAKLKHDSDLHILFTSRQFKFKEDYPEDLNIIDSMYLEPFEEVDALFDFFCSHKDTPCTVAEKRTQILDVSLKSFWLLAYALKSCLNTEVDKEPINWIKDEVKRDLRILENCRDSHADQYPKIVVALSPLYKTETQTSENYLTDNFKFTSTALNGLVERGEITKQTDSYGNRFYGLPHSAIADAYWEHGREYIPSRELQQYENFLYNYATANVPNGLRAIISTDKSVANVVLNRIYQSDAIINIVEKEPSPEIVAAWLDHFKFFHDYNNEHLINALTKKITGPDILFNAERFLKILLRDSFEIAHEFWLLIVKQLANHIVGNNNYKHSAAFIVSIKTSDEDFASELCNIIATKSLSEKINSCEINEIGDVAFLIVAICLGNFTVGGVLCRHLNTRTLASKLSRVDAINNVNAFLAALNMSQTEVAPKICSLLDLKQLADTLSKNENQDYVGSFLFTLCEINSNIAKELLTLMHKADY